MRSPPAIGVLLLASTCATVGHAQEAAGPPAPRATGSLQVFIENDVIFGHDDDYTSGLGLRWTSPELERGVGALAWLPTFDDPTRVRQLTLTLGQEMYTPSDTEAEVPPPGQHPYAGVLALDIGVHSLGELSLHSYSLRLGLVGPSSGAEQVQREFHELLDIPVPQGWDTQLDDEFLLNLDYRYQRRLLRLGTPETWGHDLTWSSGAGLGNYYVGADTGLLARLGLRLPRSFGVPQLRGTGGELVGSSAGPGTGWWGYAFGGAHVHGVARFLPADGNTWQDDAGVERDDLFTSISAGFALGYGRLQVVYTINDLGGQDELRDRGSGDYGTFAIAWSL